MISKMRSAESQRASSKAVRLSRKITVAVQGGGEGRVMPSANFGSWFAEGSGRNLRTIIRLGEWGFIDWGTGKR